MPTNRTRVKRHRRPSAESWQIEFLKYGEVRAAAAPHPWMLYKFEHVEARQAWEEHRGELLPAWIAEHPGTRPWAWWEFEAEGVDLGGQDQSDFLDRQGYLTTAERQALKKLDHKGLTP